MKKNFTELNISPQMCEVLKHNGIIEATPVQEEAIPAVRSGRDVIVQAQTGTGKTLAFLLPIFEKVKINAPVAQALIVTPTRELTIQIAKVAAKIGAAAGVIPGRYGGQDVLRQKQKLGAIPISSSGHRGVCSTICAAGHWIYRASIR